MSESSHSAVWWGGCTRIFVGDWLVDHRGGADRKDITGEQTGGSGAAIFIGTLLDNVPVSIILGMGLALGGAVNLAFWQPCMFRTSQKG